jgi:surface polysaccharide O-acyltransferase-like enzyme
MPASNFFAHYWRAFVWIALAFFTLGAVIAAVVTYTPRSGINPVVAPLLVIGGIAAFSRFLIDGGRLKREQLDKQTTDNFVLNLVLWAIQLAILTAVWPVVEIIRQAIFLSRARAGWRRGEILVSENGRELRSA